MKKHSFGTKWRLMWMNMGWKRTPQTMRMTR
jgi:predicted small integral membrane protein